VSARPVRAWLELLRVSLVPTLVADLCAGVALAHGAPSRVAAIFPVSLLLFVGGMALNARVDLEEDRRTRPNRPLPSGAVAPSHAATLALFGLIAAPVVAWFAGGSFQRDLALATAALALAIATYHSPIKRSEILGPLLLGAIRGGDLLLGAIGTAGMSPGCGAAGFAAAMYATYVAGASFIAHQEDRDARALPLRAGALLCLLAIVLHAARAVSLRLPAPDLPLEVRVAVVVAVWHLFSVRGGLRLFRPKGFGLIPVVAFARLFLSRMPLLPAAAAFAAGNVALGVTSIVAFCAVYALVRFVPPT